MKTKVIKGTVVFEATQLDVTDPGYDKDVWCRLKVDIVPGEYIYKAYIRNIDGSKERVTQLSIINISAKSRVRIGKLVGDIGVDAGLAGFFENKPDYDFKQWEKVCAMLIYYPGVYEAKKENALQCNGVFSTSGSGDGSYGVYELLDWKDNRCGYTILFM